MDEPEKSDRPSLEDEIFGTARPDGRGPPRSGKDQSAVRWPLRPPTELDSRTIGLTTAGFVSFVLVDSVMMYAPLRAPDRPGMLPQMITLVLLAFGLGGLMVCRIRGGWRPFGVGMMLGWVFLTLLSAGFLTGLNP